MLHAVSGCWVVQLPGLVEHILPLLRGGELIAEARQFEGAKNGASAPRVLLFVACQTEMAGADKEWRLSALHSASSLNDASGARVALNSAIRDTRWKSHQHLARECTTTPRLAGRPSASPNV